MYCTYHLKTFQNLISIYFFSQPGDAKSVTLVSIGGHKVIRGGNGIADGPIDSSWINEVMQKVNANSFGHEDYPDARLILPILLMVSDKIIYFVCFA